MERGFKFRVERFRDEFDRWDYGPYLDNLFIESGGVWTRRRYGRIKIFTTVESRGNFISVLNLFV